ncbi:MAG TPA: hypothetical protein VE129_20420 [Thermoanaerobaculia bacterium]|nr:hypothetical protein [Thermoanaerobaculia bacterium]
MLVAVGIGVQVPCGTDFVVLASVTLGNERTDWPFASSGTAVPLSSVAATRPRTSLQ